MTSLRKEDVERSIVAIPCRRILSELSEGDLAEYRKSEVGFVFQFENLSPILTAQENVELPMRILGLLPREERVKRSNELLSWVNMRNRANHPPHALSGGERQRIAVLVALANDPKLILADEPTGELDSENSKILSDIFTNMSNEFGKTIILVTHDPGIAQIGDNKYEMKDGEIIGEMTPRQFASFCHDCSGKKIVHYCSGCGKKNP